MRSGSGKEGGRGGPDQAEGRRILTQNRGHRSFGAGGEGTHLGGANGMEGLGGTPVWREGAKTGRQSGERP